MSTINLNQEERKINQYDILRVIATFLVVVGHGSYLKIQTALGGVDYLLPTEVSEAYNGILLSFTRSLVGPIYKFHMPLFFILSGLVYCYGKKQKNFDEFTIAKVKSLLYPFFIFGLLFMIPIKTIGSFYDYNEITNIVRSFLSGGEGGHLWFLPAMFWAQVVFL